jgi:hypothetical protein
MREKYWQRAKLWHPGREFRNKMTNLKGLYTDWVWLQQQTGCGRGSNGEVIASADWWEKEIKVILLTLLLPLFQVFIDFFCLCPMRKDIYADIVQIFLFRTDQTSKNLGRVILSILGYCMRYIMRSLWTVQVLMFLG